MRLHNDQGTPVDPVPFVVTVLASFLVLFSFGPGYLMGLGFGFEQSLVVVACLFACTTAGGYYRLVLRARPKRRAEIPGPVRLKRLYYAVLIGLALCALLLLPLFM
jgi:hypothetical protein